MSYSVNLLKDKLKELMKEIAAHEELLIRCENWVKKGFNTSYYTSKVEFHQEHIKKHKEMIIDLTETLTLLKERTNNANN